MSDEEKINQSTEDQNISELQTTKPTTTNCKYGSTQTSAPRNP
jgi:hypothetical protein